MVFRAIDCGKLAGIAAMGFMLAVSGCQSGDTLGALNVPGIGGGDRQQQTTDNRVTAEELLAYCPSVAIRDSDAIFNSYERNAADDPSKLTFRASITDSTRSCSYQGGMLTMTIAAAGRVIPGPAGSVGNVTLPIRVTVFRDAEEISSRVINHQVAIADTAGATQFMFVDSSFSMPNPTTRNIRVLVGFEGSASAGR